MYAAEVISPSAFGFSAEFQGDHPAYDEFDEYLRNEFTEREPEWDARFGKATWRDPEINHYDYVYLLHGNVPEATSQADAEHKVRELVERVSARLKSLEHKAGRAIPKPKIRVWRWR